MTLRNLLATNCLLVGWGIWLFLACSVLTVNVGPWPYGLPAQWFAEAGFIAAVCVGVGVFLRRDQWQGEANIAARLAGGPTYDGPDSDVSHTAADQWPDGLSGVIWLP